MVKLDAFKENGRISISEESFHHLLSCLDNQKYMDFLNADAISPDTDYKKVQQENQMAIDNFNNQCKELLFGKVKKG